MRVFILCAFLAGCANTEVAVQFGARSIDGDTEPAATLTVTQRVGKRGVCSYIHTSDPTKGRPVDHADDFNHDFGGCGIRWGGDR